MSSEKSKSRFGGKPRPLPDTAYVSLTEAITWIGYNDARDDDYFVDRINRKARENSEKRHSVDGPEWLLPHLELLEEGKTWEDVPDLSDYELGRLTHQLSNIKGRSEPVVMCHLDEEKKDAQLQP